MRPFRGFAYLAVLFLVAVLGIGLAAIGAEWRIDHRREQEEDLIDIGEQYRRAIEHYYLSSPAGHPQFPRMLEDLLLDPRYPAPRRYLRALYADPLTGQGWATLPASDGGIAGVYSLSEAAPLQSRRFTEPRYRDRKFVASIPGLRP